MLINQETGKVYQFARQALRRKNAISEPTCTEASPRSLRFLPSPDVYLVSAVPEWGQGGPGLSEPAAQLRLFPALRHLAPLHGKQRTDLTGSGANVSCRSDDDLGSINTVTGLYCGKGSLGLSSELRNYTNTMTLTEIKF